jgi:proteasome accessory factor C
VDVAGEPRLAGMLRSAASAGEVVELTYTTLSRGDTSVRSVEPWSVFTSLGNWYLSALCRRAGAERVFRLDRIRRAVPTGERFTPPSAPPPPEVRYTPSEEDVRAVIELDAEARWVTEYYPVEILEERGGGLLIRFSAYDPSVAAGLLLRLGPAARLVDGTEVGDALVALRRRILARYGAA